MALCDLFGFSAKCMRIKSDDDGKKCIEKHWHRSNGSSQIKRSIDYTRHREGKNRAHSIPTHYTLSAPNFAEIKNSIATYCIQTILICHSKNCILPIFNNIHWMEWDGSAEKNHRKLIQQKTKTHTFSLSINFLWLLGRWRRMSSACICSMYTKMKWQKNMGRHPCHYLQRKKKYVPRTCSPVHPHLPIFRLACVWYDCRKK